MFDYLTIILVLSVLISQVSFFGGGGLCVLYTNNIFHDFKNGTTLMEAGCCRRLSTK